MKTKQAAELYFGSVAHGLPSYGYTDDTVLMRSRNGLPTPFGTTTVDLS